MRIPAVLLAGVAVAAQAGEPPLRPSARLILQAPAALRPGQCVRYEEGGAGWVMTEPVYYLQGEVVSTAVQLRRLGKCPVLAGKRSEPYSRDEFNRQARAFPCVAPDVPERDEQIGIVRLRVADWETPYARQAANAGRLYRGMFIHQKLEKGMEIELEADLLGRCDQ